MDSPPPFSLSDLLFGMEHSKGSFWLVRGDAGLIPKGKQLWLMCGDVVFKAEATGVESTDSGGPTGDESCTSPKLCPPLTVMKPTREIECRGRYVLGLPASFRPPHPVKLRREDRSYNLKCEGCGLRDAKPVERDSPPSEVQKLVASAVPGLARKPHGISSLFLDGLAPVHWIAGSTGHGRRMKIVWMAMAQAEGRARVLIKQTISIPRTRIGRLNSRHMMQHSCGVPFYSVPRPILFFSIGKSAERYVVSAEQLPADVVRFAVWQLSRTALRQKYRFPIEMPDPKF